MANLTSREAGNHSFYFGQPFAQPKFKNSITEEEVENNTEGHLNISAPIAK